MLAGIMQSTYTGSADRTFEAQALFRYVASYLASKDAVPIDPFNLPLRDERFETKKEELLLAFGAVRDAAPDSWGRARMEREAGRQLDDIEFIHASGADRSGFLAFAQDDKGPRVTAPWAKAGEFDSTRFLDLGGLGLHIKDAANVRLAPEEQRLLLVFGSSLGGARPKATVEVDGHVWLAKSSRPDDQYNYPRGEHAAMVLAGLCGMRVPETRVIKVMDRDVYLIRRFDREVTENGVVRRHGFISALSAFGISDNAMTVKTEASYKKLLGRMSDTKTSYVTADMRELFRRVVFNILVCNTDDHPRNHGFLFKDGIWRLSPLYDVQPLIYRSGSTRHLAMRFGEQGSEGTIANLVSGARDFGLSRAEAASEVDDLLRCFSSWREVFKNAGVPDDDMPGYEATFALADDWRRELRESPEF